MFRFSVSIYISSDNVNDELNKLILMPFALISFRKRNLYRKTAVFVSFKLIKIELNPRTI